MDGTNKHTTVVHDVTNGGGWGCVEQGYMGTLCFALSLAVILKLA